MNQHTLNSLLLAKTNIERAKPYCYSTDRMESTIGARSVQDALEDTFRACLLHIDKYPDGKNITFPEILSEVKKIPQFLIKIGNSLRNISKHTSYVIDPVPAQEFYSVAHATMSSLTEEVFGKSLLKIYASELIKDEEVKEYLILAYEYLIQDKIYEALEYIRRAFYKAFEAPYCIASWENSDPITANILRLISRAPIYVKEEKFIENEVKDPFDYIQHNFDSISFDLLNYEIPKQDFLNVYRLTPRTIFCEKSKSWKSETNFKLKTINKEQAKYLLGLTIDMIKKKEKYQDSQQVLDSIKEEFVITQDTKLYEKASLDSVPLFEVKKGEKFEVEIIVPPLQGDMRFVQIREIKNWDGKPSWISGYILETDGTFPKIKCT